MFWAEFASLECSIVILSSFSFSYQSGFTSHSEHFSCSPDSFRCSAFEQSWRTMEPELINSNGWWWELVSLVHCSFCRRSSILDGELSTINWKVRTKHHLLFSLFYEYINFDDWMVQWNRSMCKKFSIPCPPPPMHRDEKPIFSLFMLKYLCSLLVGITSSVWLCSGKTVESWKLFIERLKGREQRERNYV